MNLIQIFSIISCIFIIISLFISQILAQIIPDKSASQSNQPAISKSSNNAFIVNIVTPNNKGISFNEYARFNTPNSGTVLNNSVNGANTSIAGFVNANPFLNGGYANLIVNQVNSSNPSLLKGNLEIAGKRADLLIANPSGISINGLNIINASSSSFATAKLHMNAGDLKSLKLTPILNASNPMQGKIVIKDQGLNDTSSNYTNIIANTISIASSIHSNELNLISTNDMVISDKDRLFNKIRPTSSSSSSMPSISIDSSSLGGMYANKINIIATKDGVGVNNAGIISASKISINANGDIINLNTIKAKDELQLNSAKTISNQDSALISSSNDMSLFAGLISNLTNSNIIAANHLNIKANNLNNFSQSVIKTRFEQYIDVLNLTCGSCRDRTFALSVDIQTIKMR
ncbi:filamentous hemagglutinin N-terminal domain-containing protein [Campylobacter californiensis]|uniref:filamentous hemagglutinin N-terminal domain-containing protein n=1 Tax=Campylobacter californiensis TaxID=1032243 RepID=UPI001475DD85|nr:filamentous hemagglutinin N-terminal domain-containing protein [Campylobacter sp. RM12916]MBE3609446.1 filamentous hemagglutinin N-terminal domain-containing protein [Campylobacter sp. RM12916]